MTLFNKLYITHAISMLFLFCSTNLVNAQSSSRIKIIFNTRTMIDGECSGRKGICIDILFSQKASPAGYGIAELSVEGETVILNFLEDPDPASPDENTFYIPHDRDLPLELAQLLGYDKIILLQGEYILDKSRNPLGNVKIRAIVD